MSELGAVLAALVLIVLIIVEFPIAFAFAAATIVLATTSGRDLALILPMAFWQTGGFALLALPLFIIAGIVMRDSGSPTICRLGRARAGPDPGQPRCGDGGLLHAVGRSRAAGPRRSPPSAASWSRR